MESSDNSRPKTAASRGETPFEETNSRTNLILELSNRISEQDARITELENMVHEQDKVIEQAKKDHQRLKDQQRLDELKAAENKPSPELTELQQIAAEINALKASKKTKAKKKKIVRHETPPELDFRGSSGISRDSGIVHGDLLVAETPEVEEDTRIKHAIKTSLSDDDDKWDSDTEENQHGKGDHQNGDHERRNNDSPLNIRQISAMKKKRKAKDINEMVSNMDANMDYFEVDNLIQTIDQTAAVPSLSQVSM